MTRPLYIPGAITRGWRVHGYVDDDGHLNLVVACLPDDTIYDISEDLSDGDHEMTFRFTNSEIEREYDNQE